MRALPSGPWIATPPGLEGAPAQTDWHWLDATVAHGFTHFDLVLALATGSIEAHQALGEWWPIAELDRAGLPTVFAKGAALMRSMK